MAAGPGPVLALIGLVTMGLPARLAHATAPAPPGVLAVPYLAQSELLCGGAALAMVERWWGRRGVYAEDFRHLVRPEEGGIRTTDLVAAASARGWRATPFRGDAARVRQALTDSVPVLALIQVASRRYHYVVIVGWDDDSVVFHDPAVRPYARLARVEFERQWNGADHWALLVTARPGDAAVPPLDTAAPPPTPLPCQPWTTQAAAAANQGELGHAERLLAEADSACPGEPVLERELAGVRFRQGRYDEAIRLTRGYLHRAPRDSLAWQLLAGATFLSGDRVAALGAWNAIGRPVVDLLRISGLHQVRFPVIARQVSIEHGHLLTAGALAKAGRRVAAIPGIAMSRVGYNPVPGGLAEVTTALAERRRVPTLTQFVTRNMAQALSQGTVSIRAYTLAGLGEQWSTSWRWEAADPALVVGLTVPARLLVPGIVEVTGRWEDYRFTGGLIDQDRHATTLAFDTWWSGSVESRVAARLERWSGDRDALALSIGGGWHLAGDRLAILGTIEHAIGLGGDAGYNRFHAGAWWRSAAATRAVAFEGRLGFDWTSNDTPLAIQPLVAGNLGRAIPLRAHPYIRDDRLPLDRIAEVMIHGGIGLDRTLVHAGVLNLGAGVFADAARRLSTPTSASAARTWLDVGAGVSAGMVGSSERLRIDVARGIADDPRWALTVGVAMSWPPVLRTGS